MKRMGVVAMLLIGLLFTAAGGQVEVREEVEPTRQTPRGTLKLLVQAMEQSDAEALRSILLGENETEQQMVEAMVETAQSVHRFREQAIEPFGDQGALPLIGAAPGASAGELETIDDATETITGDRAVVRFANVQTTPVSLVIRDEQWYVPVAELSAKLDERELLERIVEIRAFNGVITAVTGEIAEGKYESAEQARQALSSQMMRAVMPEQE